VGRRYCDACFGSTLGIGLFDMAGVAGGTCSVFDVYVRWRSLCVARYFDAWKFGFFLTERDRFLGQLLLAMLILIMGISGLMAGFDPDITRGGKIGYVWRRLC